MAVSFRAHEVGILVFYSSVALIWKLCTSHQISEAIIAMIWSSVVLAVSFTEAWVKFKAPFLRKYVAVDVGRHVFAALAAAECGLAGVFWIFRLLSRYRDQVAGSMTLQSLNSILPSLSTFVLVFQVVWLSPKLYVRAKAKIANEADSDQLSESELSELKSLKDSLSDPIPSSRLHMIFASLELVKVLCLQAFALIVLNKN